MRLHTVVSTLMITLLLSWALNSAAQVPPTPTATQRLSVTARLSQVSGHSVITCTVTNSSGHAVRSQTVSVQKAAAVTGPFADWMSKKTNVNGQALLPYAQPTYTWYVRCAASVAQAGAGARAQETLFVSATKTILGKKPRPSPTATPRPTATATPRPTATPTPTVAPTATPRPTTTPSATPTPTATVTATPEPTATPAPTATPISSVTFVRSDTSTQGNWVSLYGGQGYVVVGGTANLPSFASVVTSGQSDYTWAASTTDPRAPLTSSAAGAGRTAACWYTYGTLTVDVNLTDGVTHQVALYALDWDSGNGRTERMDVVDPANGSVLDSRTVSSFTGGQYLVYNVTGHVQFRITGVAGVNAVLSGLFFGGTPLPPTPTVTPTATPRPTVTTTATPRPTVTPTATPRPTATPSPTTTPTGTPFLIGVSPASGATGVPVSSSMAGILPVTATFNQSVQFATINFTLKDSSGNLVASTVWYSDATDTATLTPEATLANSTTYTATISGAENSNGVVMPAPVTWSFTTSAATTTLPTAMTASPPSNAPSVDISTPIAVNFNEAVLGSSISSDNFTLTTASGTVVPATITYTATGALYTATLTPTAPLAYSTTYTATISGVTDAANNTMSSPYTWSFATAASTQTITQLPLAYQSNLQYVGAFRVPYGNFGDSSFEYALQGIAFNPANNSLFMSGYQGDNSIAEISIPSSIVNSSNWSALATASVLQPFVKVSPLIPDVSNLTGKGTSSFLGGLMVYNGQLIGTQYLYYDNSGTTYVTHFRFDSLNLSSAEVEGMFEVGGVALECGAPGPSGAAGFYAGYMGPIPSNWQSALARRSDWSVLYKHHQPKLFWAGCVRLQSEYALHFERYTCGTLCLLHAKPRSRGERDDGLL